MLTDTKLRTEAKSGRCVQRTAEGDSAVEE
jgi:hypothetical protein